jgi:hypothetical protein
MIYDDSTAPKIESPLIDEDAHWKIKSDLQKGS